ncbi:hypothetical protein M9435_002514 [Picochlorum sp. BPE23]|nr:hypothetical protein M9435_002514 [Picochlorum sp. BPE23]
MPDRQPQSATKPSLDRSKAGQINLTVIQRMDSEVEEVIATSGHVALYDFDTASSQWSRKDVEGSLFLVKRRGSPRFRFVILNKKGDDNYWEDVGSNFSCEKQEPYVMYRNGAAGVVGIWFYETADCQKFAELFEKIASTFAAPEDASIDMQRQHQSMPESGGMFQNAQMPMEGSQGTGSHQAAVVSSPSAGTGNPLAQVFAGMKVAQKKEQPPSASSLPLLTPQHFQHHQQQNQGTALLQSLNATSRQTQSDTSVDKVQSLLHSLSQNRAFCELLCNEMKKCGLFDIV